MKKLILILMLICVSTFAYANWDSSTNMQALSASAGFTQIQNSLKAIDNTSGTAPTTISVGTTVQFEGATADASETSITVTDPTGDRTVTLPDADMNFTTGLPVEYGGTETTSLTDGGVLLGSGTGAVTAMSVLADGSIIVGDGTTDPVALACISSSTGDVKHECGGIEADISAVAKGGIVTGTGTGTMGLLAAGSNNQSLVLDSGETAGMKWVGGVIATKHTFAGGASTTGTTVTLADASRYRIDFEFRSNNGAGHDMHLNIRFNNNSSANYDYVQKEDTLSAETVTRVAGGTKIDLHVAADPSNADEEWISAGTMELFTYSETTSNVMHAFYRINYIHNEISEPVTYGEIKGSWNQAVASSITFYDSTAGADIKGTVWVYTFADS